MKKIGLTSTALCLAMAVLLGCATPGRVVEEVAEAERPFPHFYYTFVFFRIPVEHFQAFPWPSPALLFAYQFQENDAFFDAVAEASDFWAQAIVGEPHIDYTSSDILYDFLQEQGFSQEDAAAEVSHLAEAGNNIFVFYYAGGPNYVVVMYTVRHPSPAVNVSILWATVRSENVQRIIPMEEVKTALMTLFDSHAYVMYAPQARSGASHVTQQHEVLSHFAEMGVLMPAMHEVLYWVKDPAIPDFAYGMSILSLETSTVFARRMTYASVMVFRGGDSVYLISFWQVQPPQEVIEDRVVIPTAGNRDVFARYLERILAADYTP